MRVKEWEGDVVFLHEVGQGAADRSYGIQVARLAGLPAAVVSARQGRAARSWKRARRPARPTGWSTICRCFRRRCGGRRRRRQSRIRVAAALAAINPDELTPSEALEALYRLKGLDG